MGRSRPGFASAPSIDGCFGRQDCERTSRSATGSLGARTSQWSDDVVWWQVYPLGALDAEKDALPEGAAPVPWLRRLEPWLDYLIQVGANGLALNPIFASETHGYDTVDYWRIDPRLGSEDDFRWLSAACSARGIKLLLDGVFNHVGRSFPAFADVLEHRRQSRFVKRFRIDFNRPGSDGFSYQDFEGHSRLVALNPDNPEVRAFLVDVMRFWLDRGADGWRLDAAPSTEVPAYWPASASHRNWLTNRLSRLPQNVAGLGTVPQDER